ETYLWMMPMFLLGLFVLQKKPSKLIKAFCILALVLATLNFNAVYYTIVIMSVFFIYQLLLNLKFYKNKRRDLLKENRRYLKNIIIVSLLAFLIVLPQFYPIVKNTFLARNTAPAAVNPYHRPFEDLFEQSARPLSYFLPAAVHPLFGKFTEQFIGSQLYGISFTEHTLYLGWVPLIFAFIAFKRWRKNRRLRTTNHEPRTDEFSYIGFFILLAIVAWFFSQPPWWQWGPLKIYMPSFFMYKVLPMFRAYCRFGIVLMLAVAVLAGFGLKFVLEKFNNKTTKTGIAVLVMLLVLFEFWNYPPFKVIDVSRFPAVYNWLRLEPKDTVIAEYPLDARDQNEMYKLYQTRHEKKMINASARGTQANNIALTITQLSSSRTAGILKWMGVRYVIVHSDGYLNTELIEKKEEFEQISKNPGLRIVRNFSEQGCPQDGIMCIQKTGPIDVYEVIASPIEPEVKK
ncbi:MAG: hypothetical protein KKE64_02210, partial [Candidatus Omnitrophica bacterium]|nr:hypothetical protein [Candidatus Omnitrophota bacterium]